MNEVVIIVRGGIVQAVHAKQEIKVIVIDHDNLEYTPRDEILDMTTAKFSPDSIGRTEEVIAEEVEELKRKFEL